MLVSTGDLYLGVLNPFIISTDKEGESRTFFKLWHFASFFSMYN